MKKGLDKSIYSKEALLDIELLIQNVSKKHNLDPKNVLNLINKTIEKNGILIPCNLFQNRELGVLEVITKFLKEQHNLTYKNISLLLNRDQRTIWATYNLSKKKNSTKFESKKSKYNIPASIFKERKLGPLEVLTHFLKTNHNLTYKEISLILNRDQRTIWTACNRAKNKI